MADERTPAADDTAVRVALWRAMHVEVDPPPHMLDDEIGLQLAAPDDGWRSRPDMDPAGTSWFRAGIVARARFVEDLVAEQAGQGVAQYVILGAGLDTFAQRRPEVASRLRVFEVDQPGPQSWKCKRLIELGFGVPEWLQLVPVGFEAGGSWWDKVVVARFDPGQPAVVVSTGVSMYLTKDADAAALREIAGLAPASTFAMTFLLPTELHDDGVRPGFQAAERGARAVGTPFISFYTRTKCCNWLVTPDLETSSTCRQPCSTSDTLPAGRTVDRRVGGGATGSNHVASIPSPGINRHLRAAPRGRVH
jgi:methyltransferase (TIGR00027 family)